MRPSVLTVWMRRGLLAAGALAFTSCALAPQAAEYSRAVARAAIYQQIAQLGFGAEARFAPCAGHECPTTTPKTVGGGAAPAARTGADDEGAEAAPASGIAAPGEASELLVVMFASGQTALDAKSRQLIDRFLAEHDAALARIEISGRTDNTGSAKVNARLARQRAAAVGAHLRARLGAGAPPILMDYRGKCCYLAANDDSHGRQVNRRVEIRLVPAPAAEGRDETDR